MYIPLRAFVKRGRLKDKHIADYKHAQVHLITTHVCVSTVVLQPPWAWLAESMIDKAWKSNGIR